MLPVEVNRLEQAENTGADPGRCFEFSQIP